MGEESVEAIGFKQLIQNIIDIEINMEKKLTEILYLTKRLCSSLSISTPDFLPGPENFLLNRSILSSSLRWSDVSAADVS